MANTEALREEWTANVGHILLIDGCPYGWTDKKDLVGFDVGTDVDVRIGFVRTGKLKLAIDPRKSAFQDNQCTFEIEDFEGDLADLFKQYDDTEEPLDLPIAPGDDLSAYAGSVAIDGRNIGTERIGASSERHQFPVPSTATWGLQHYAANAAESLQLDSAPVSDDPIVWAGRKVALYRLYRDHITYPGGGGQSTWRPFSEAKCPFKGTIRDAGEVDGRRWQFACDGFESLMRKGLGLLCQTVPVKAVGDITLATDLGNDETKIGIELKIWTAWGVPDAGGIAGDYGDDLFETTITSGTTSEIRAQVAAAIEAATQEGSPSFDEIAGAHCFMDLGNGTISIAVPDRGVHAVGDQDVNPTLKARIRLALHKKVWDALGFAVDGDAAQNNPETEPQLFVDFVQYPGTKTIGGEDAPGPGYYVADFTTVPVGWNEANDPMKDDVDNNSAGRLWHPRYTGGATTLLADPGAGQVVRLGNGLGDTSVAHTGQIDRPPASDPNDVDSAHSGGGFGAVNRQGLWLFFGKRRSAWTDEEFDEYQVARASWANGSAAESGLVSGNVIVVTEWLNPRRFGFDRSKLTSDWVQRANAADQGIQAVPILALDYMQGTESEQAHIVIQRLLRTTGTSTGWSSFASDPAAAIDAGDNEPGGLVGFVRMDAEVADLGLGIPDEWLHHPLDWAKVAYDVEDTKLLEVKVGFSPGTHSEDLIRGIMQSLGWCWHMRQGKLGIFKVDSIPSQDDVEVVLSQSVKAAKFVKGRTRHRQERRKYAPIDKIVMNYARPPHLNQTRKKVEMQSPDRGATYRPNTMNYEFTGWGRWSVPKGWYERQGAIAKFWEKRHFEVKGWPVFRRNPGEDVWPGTIVRLIEDAAVDPGGAYGINGRVGIVLATEEDLATGSKTCDVMVYSTPTVLPRYHAPSARARGYSTTESRIYVDDNWQDVEVLGWSDADHFIEPAYDGIAAFGGNAAIRGMQWNGQSWNFNFTAEVTGVGEAYGYEYLQVTSFSGTYYRDMDTIIVLRPLADQPANNWVRELYGVVCNPDGTFSEGTGYKWED